MKHKNIIEENIFNTIAKTLALTALKSYFPKAMKQVNEDPEVVSAMENMLYYTEKVNKLLPEFCKRRPESSLCKKGATKTK